MATFTSIKYDNPRKMSFTINDSELSIVNAIRRIILSEIPNVAFYFDPYDIEHNDIKINKNTCALHNEFLAHRISLVPLCFTENEINEFDNSKWKFQLIKQNNTYETLEVTTKDFKIYNEDGKEYSDAIKERILPKNSITNEYILLTKLKPNLYDDTTPPKGEMIDIMCIPSVNTAMKHARWCPVSQCSFGNTIDKDLADKKFEELLETFEKDLGRKATKDEKQQQLNRFNTLEVYRCFKKNKYDEANHFDFKIESECALRPAYLFFKACKILIEKLDKFVLNIKNNNTDAVKIIEIKGLDNFYNVEIYNENYTLVNVLQANIFNMCFREMKSQENPLDYIGYTQPHPLDNLMLLKLKIAKKEEQIISKDFVANLLINFTNDIIAKLRIFTKEWLDVSFNDIKDIKEVVEFRDV